MPPSGTDCGCTTDASQGNAAGPGNGTACLPCLADPMLDCLLGMLVGASPVWFVRVDPASGAVQNIGPMNANVQGTETGHNAVDLVGHRYFVLVEGSSIPDSFLSIDINTGTVLVDVPLVYSDFSNWHFDATNGNLVGMSVDSGNVNRFARLNPATGTFTTSSFVVPGMDHGHQDDYAFDAQNQRYYVFGSGFSLPDTLFTLDATNGAVLGSVPWPAGFGHPHFDDASGTLVGLHWDGTSMHLARWDPGTSAYTVGVVIPGPLLINTGLSTINVVDHRFYTYSGSLSSPGSANLVTFDSNTGQVSTSVPWPSIFVNPEYEG
jgi:hypothetical protein